MHRLLLFGAIAAGIPASAQWFKLPTPGIPRTPDGKPDMSAPAPRKANGQPDLSGMWQVNGKYLTNLAADLKPGEVPFQPWAEAVFKARQDGSKGQDDPAARCLPGMPKLNALPYPFKIFETPDTVIILFEGFTTFRQIHLDGRPLPKDPQPFWMGYSVGKWQGNELVVETVGMHENTWMDNAGHPHTDALHITEKFRRPTYGRMEIEMTFDDPKTYTKPWTITEVARAIPDTELLEFVCQENEKD